MDDSDNSQEDIKNGNRCQKRCPQFTIEEIGKLVELVEKYKFVLLNKTTNANTIRCKDVAWVRIGKAFNNQGFPHERSVERLITKWKNLKKQTRILFRNDSDLNQSQHDPIFHQIWALLVESDSNEAYSADVPPELSDDEEDTKNQVNRRKNGWDRCKVKKSVSEDIADESGSSRERSVNFSPQETKLLIQCVREEKNIVFNKGCSLNLRRRAWNRIANSFNKQSPVERTSKALHTKFVNMKNKAKLLNLKSYMKDFSRKHSKLVNENIRQIKPEPIEAIEPVFEVKSHIDESHDDGFNDLGDVSGRGRLSPDPLSTVLNGDAGAPWYSADNREVVKRQLELLDYQMETAKLERQRLLDAMQAEKRDHETRATEAALRLRAARLEAVAMETRLTPAHPALAYPPPELPAREYAASTEFQSDL